MTSWACGVDEAGRGPLAGPVCAAAVILNPELPIQGLADSKKLSATRREKLARDIQAKAISYSIAWASVSEIDQLNILRATLLAMRRAIDGMGIRPSIALIDGDRLPELTIPAQAIVGGDAMVASISAASILAKTARDSLMLKLHARYPEYGFDRHKGYATNDHRRALAVYGPTTEHRMTFAPVRAAMALRAEMS